MRPVTKISIFGFRLGLVALAMFWLAIFVGTHLPNLSIDLDLAHHVSDKSMHFTAFFGLGAMLCYVTNSKRWFRRFAAIGIAGMAYGAFDEITQAFVPGRVPSVLDFIADAAGLWTAIALYVAAKYAYESFYVRGDAA